ncbi:MAG: SufS family cysteine desulfurase [Phycisphaeraceae bacterium]
MTTTHIPSRPQTFDVAAVRADFPILHQQVHGHPLVYLDNAATSQKPQSVIDALNDYYRAGNANVHRGMYDLSIRATAAYERARQRVAQFLHAFNERSIIFTRGTTESINLVAQSYARNNLRPGDQVLITAMEHHSNIVPWQLVCQQTGAKLLVAPIDDRGQLIFSELEKLLTSRVKIVSAVHVSNALGTINDVQRIIASAQKIGAITMIDGAQAAPHQRIDVEQLGCDFYAFSGHKLFGPTGIGVLYGRYELLADMNPWQGGGEMIQSVTFEKTTFAEPPARFEAGTPHIAGAIGLAAAIDYLDSIDFDAAVAHEHALLEHGTRLLQQLPGVRLIGTAANKAAVLSFVIDGLHPYDIAPLLDQRGIAVRTGHHCAQPVMQRFNVPATVRASLAFYNTTEELDAFADALRQIIIHNKSVPTPVSSKRGMAVFGQTVAPHFPDPAADSPALAAADITDAFELLDSWDQRYDYMMDLANRLPPMPDAVKTEQTRVHGCQSTVHMIARTRPDTNDQIDFLADSDSQLVRGLIAVLAYVFSGQRAADILAFNVEQFFRGIGLDQHLTMGRRNGLKAMVDRILALAKTLSEK